MIKKLFKRFIAFVIIINMTFANFIFVAHNIVYAVSEEAVIIEGGKIIFNAYFKDENDEKIYRQDVKISEGTKLYVSIELTQSQLENAKVSFNNANFKIKDEINDSNIDYVNIQTGEIFFKTIDSNQKVELEIPIMFEKMNQMDLDYFNGESEIILSGKYYNSSEIAKEINDAKIQVQLNWVEGEKAVVNWNYAMEKSIINEEKNRIIIQEKIDSKANFLPKMEDEIHVTAPKIGTELPDEVYIVQNGTKVSQDKIINGYNLNTGELKYTKSFLNEDVIDWSRDLDTYKIIYIYNGNFDDIKDLEIIQGKIQINTKLLNNDEPIMSKEFSGGISFNTGSNTSICVNSVTKEIYKGFVYSNSEYGTNYSEEYEVEISDKEQIDNGLNIRFEKDTFLGNKELETNQKTRYKKLMINEDNFRNILGENGEIKVITDDKNIIIDNSIPATSEGVIELELDTYTLEFDINKVENEGTLVLNVQKQIIGDADLSANDIKGIQKLQTMISVDDGITKVYDKAETILKEPKTEAYLTMSNENRTNILATNRVNKVEIIATLKTGTEDAYLYKKPNIEIKLPLEVSKVDNLEATALYAEDELEIKNAEVIEKDGRKFIYIEVDGTQTSFENKITEGIKVTINADMVIGKYIPSRDTKIIMEYENENSISSPEPVELPITIYSAYGLIKDLILNGNQERVNVKTILVNNYDNKITDLSIIGTVPNQEISQDDFENEIKNSYSATFISQNSDEMTGNIKKKNGDTIKIQYSEDKTLWADTMENANYYRIVICDTLNSKESVYIEYSLYNLTDNPKFEIEATFEGEDEVVELVFNKELSNYEEIEKEDEENEEVVDIPVEMEKPEKENEQDKDDTDETEENENKVENNTEDLSKRLEMVVQTQIGDKRINNDSKLKKGQAVTFTYIIKNTSNTDIENLKFKINYEGANVFGEYTYEEPDAYNTGVMKKFTILDELVDVSKIENNIKVINKNETKQISYQIIVKENTEALNTIIKMSADGLDEKEVKLVNAVEDAEVKPLLLNNIAREHPLIQTDIADNIMQIKNLTNSKIENLEVEMTLPEIAKFGDIVDDTGFYSTQSNFTIIEKEDNKLKLLIKELDIGEVKNIDIPVILTKNTSEGINMYYKVKTENNTYYSNIMNVLTKEVSISNVVINQTSNKENEVLKIEDEVIYTFTIENKENETKTVSFNDAVPQELTVLKVIDKKGDLITEDNKINSNLIYKDYTLEANSVVQIAIVAQVNYKSQSADYITNYAQISGNYFKTKSNIIKNDIEKLAKTEKNQKIINSEQERIENKNPNDEENPVLVRRDTVNPNANNQNSNNQNGIGTMEIKNSISGKVWIDANKNGIKEPNEKALSGITVMLADIKNGTFVKDDNLNRLEVKTDKTGKYQFEQVVPGKYIVVFEFDNIKYRNTQYHVSSATNSTNSDIITSKINVDNSQVKYGITDTLILQDMSLENIDAGLIENEIFDLSLEKYVNKITVQNSTGTVVQEFNKSQLAKIEIDSKLLTNSTVIVEYIIEVTNEGELPGYASEIIDYIPKDLSFSSEINKDWYKSTDGNVHTNALENVLINPGESKEVKLLLTKTMTENNTGVTTNKAEIAKSGNELSILDKDSKAGNNSQGEDDTSTAEIIISIRTGIGSTIGIVVIIIILLSAGVWICIKRRKEAN